jgi:hypothetical protein
MRPMFRNIIIALSVCTGVLGRSPVDTHTVANAPGGLTFEWKAPAYQLTNVIGEDGRAYIHLEVESDAVAAGFVYGAPTGQPNLPQRGRLIALPPSGGFGLEVMELTYDVVALALPLEPVPAPENPSRDGEIPLVRDQWPGYRASATLAPHPGQQDDPVELRGTAWMRDHRLSRLIFHPFRYDADRQTLEVVRHVRFHIWWEQPAHSADTPRPQDPFADVLEKATINHWDLDGFRAPLRADPLLQKDTGALAAAPDYKILVAEEGIYRLDYDLLALAGLPIDSLDPNRLHLSHAGVEVATQWEGNGDLIWQPGEQMLFYARPELTRFAGYDVYGLSWGGGAGQPMAARSGDPTALPQGTGWTTVLAEQNWEYDALHVGRDGDHWFWRPLKLPDLVSETFEITLEQPRSTTSAELTLWLHGFTGSDSNPDHHVRFAVNGTVVGDAQWDEASPYTATLSLPAGLLQAGLNSVTVSLPGDTGSPVEGVWVDAFAVRYGLDKVNHDLSRLHGEQLPHAYTMSGFSTTALRVYDVTEPTRPRIVTGLSVSGDRIQWGDEGETPAEYLIVGEQQIKAPNAVLPSKTINIPPAGADYLIISHPDFVATLAPLLAHRSQEGLRVALVDVEAVYDQFGDGRMDPEAIHSFLAYAYVNWTSPPLEYVLLVGDGTYDPRGFRPDTNPTFLPPYLADVDPVTGETASDNRYADLSGDPLPDLRVGRLPVNTPAEVQAIVDKIILYESDPLPGDWNRRLLFGADNPSTAGDHHKHADAEFMKYVGPTYGFEGERIYLSESSGAPHLYTSAAAAQDALIAGLNRGALFYSYFGHASWHQEAVLETDNYAPLFHQDHISRLTNYRRWPVVLHMTCLTGWYTYLSGATLDESLLRTPDVGAVAVWGASGYGVATGHRVLHRSFYRAAVDESQRELSAAIHTALVDLYAAGVYNDLFETFHIFGDPTLKIHFTRVDLPFSVFLPIITSVLD